MNKPTAKLRRVTSETLRYYDRIGLLKPIYVDPDTNYRYYSIRQYEKLGTIIELRQLGMTIKAIEEYFTDRTLEKSVSLLSSYHDSLKKELEEKKLQEKILRRKLRFVKELYPLAPTNTVHKKHFPQRYMITLNEVAGGPKEHAYAFTRLERHLDEIAPILASDRVGVYTDETLLIPSEKYIPAYPMLFVEKEVAPPEYLQTIPEGNYLCMYYHGGRLEIYHPSFEIIKNYIKEHDYDICGHIFQIYKIDVTLTSVQEETLMEIQIPVKNKLPGTSLDSFAI